MTETAVTTGKARLSYEHLFKPYAHQPGQEEKYSVTILVPKSDVATKQRIDAAIAAAKQAGVSKCWNGAMPPVIAIPVYDGDGVRPQSGEPFGEECKGCWVFTASSKQAPQVVDLNMSPIISPTEVYSGCYARVNVNFFPYNSNGKRGIGCGLNAVQKLEDGEPLGGRISAEEAFGAPMAAAAAYQQPYPQTAPAYPQPAYDPQAASAYPQPSAYPPPAAPPQYSGYPAVDPITGMPYGG